MNKFPSMITSIQHLSVRKVPKIYNPLLDKNNAKGKALIRENVTVRVLLQSKMFDKT